MEQHTSWNSWKRSKYKKEAGYCFWCNRKTVITLDESNPLRLTVDHLYDKFDKSLRDFFVFLPRDERYVLACSECNNERSKLSCYCFQMIHKRKLLDRNFCQKFETFIEYTNQPHIKSLIEHDEVLEDRFYKALELGGIRYHKIRNIKDIS